MRRRKGEPRDEPAVAEAMAAKPQIYADRGVTWSARLFDLSLFTYHLSPSSRLSVLGRCTEALP
jgi:hypothetical protein